jgi:hypothetical protein
MTLYQEFSIFLVDEFSLRDCSKIAAFVWGSQGAGTGVLNTSNGEIVISDFYLEQIESETDDSIINIARIKNPSELILT